jgi:hypothetical protein
MAEIQITNLIFGTGTTYDFETPAAPIKLVGQIYPRSTP